MMEKAEGGKAIKKEMAVPFSESKLPQTGNNDDLSLILSFNSLILSKILMLKLR